MRNKCLASDLMTLTLMKLQADRSSLAVGLTYCAVLNISGGMEGKSVSVYAI